MKIKTAETKKPKFSVIIPVYNHANYLPAAIESIFNQTYDDWEIVVVNDGSTDNTPDVIKEYENKDYRVRGFHKENGGVSSALNEGIKNARGEFITWLSADDLFDPVKLEAHLQNIEKHPEKKFFISMWYYLVEESQVLIPANLWMPVPKDEFRVLHFFYANYIHAISVTVHRTVFEDIGLFDQKLWQGQDFDMWLRIVSKYNFQFIPVRTCVTRIHEGQTTNTFEEGGNFDAVRSLIEFANTHKFEEFFPDFNLSVESNALKAVFEIIAITLKPNAFIHKFGPSSLLLERAKRWLLKECKYSFRKNIYQRAAKIVSEALKDDHPAEVKEVLKRFLIKDHIELGKYDAGREVKKYLRYLLKTGDHKKILSLERYMIRAEKLGDKLFSDGNQYEPILYGAIDDEKEYPDLSPGSIVAWNVGRVFGDFNRISHKLELKCDHCGSEFKFNTTLQFNDKPGTDKLVCPECKTGYRFSEELFSGHHKSLYEKLNDAGTLNKTSSPRIAYFLKDANFIGGGTKVVFKHISWLKQLGAEISIYSFEPKPTWIEFKINFKQIKNFTELDDRKFDYIIVFSIFEVPGVVQRIHPSRVFLFCQGYEGYHYGVDNKSVRADKYIFDQMHSLPIGSIVVSTHLSDLFRERFNHTSYYVPNGINHEIFKPSLPLNSREKSVVFVGSPFHFLKGFSFLFNTLKVLQKSAYKIEGLKLYMIMGFDPGDKLELRKNFEEEAGFSIELLTKLRSDEVAEILKKSSLVVCSSMYEGFSLPLVEAMACGTPVITTSNMGAESFCVNGKNSYVVDYEDTQALSSAIITIMQNIDSYAAMAIEGIKTAYQFNEKNTLNALIKTIESISHFEFDKQTRQKLLSEQSAPVELSDDALKTLISSGSRTQAEEACDIVSVIIPSFNKIKYVLEAVESIEKSINKDYEIIIVDDGSTENFNEPFINNKKVSVIRNEMNLGFPKSVNLGIKSASGKYLLIVNNDTICTEGSIDRMIELAESDKKIGLVGVISNHAGGPQWDRDAKYKTIPEMHEYAKKIRNTMKGEYGEFPRVTFLFTLIKREVVDEIGGLDERFSPGYYEDDDFCLRAQLAGFKSVIAQDVFIHHYGSVSFSELGDDNRVKISDMNKELFADKWGGTPEDIWINKKQLKVHSIRYPISADDFTEHFERTLQHIEDNELGLAYIEIKQAVDSFSRSDSKTFSEIKLTEVLNLAGKVSYYNGEYDESKLYYEEELKINPESSTACQGLGEVFYAMGKTEESKTMFEWAVKNNLQNNDARKGLAEVNFKLGLPENDNTLLECDPQEIVDEAEILIERGNYNGAEEMLSRILEKEPDYIDALNDLSVIRILENNFEEALKLINKIISIDPQNEIARGNLEYISSKIGEEV
ncbi:MAG: glycosyltransferase [Melioribacteraceae bacterium]|nr:glycosyltransferase [Melioribacteraceae bacterium]